MIAAGRCTVKRYPGEKLAELIEKYPEVSRHLFRTLVERLHKTDRIVVQLAGAAKARPPQVIRQA